MQILRVLPWQNDPKARITVLSFSASGEFLLTGATGGGIHIVPAVAILTSKVPLKPRGGRRRGQGGVQRH
eukprot:6564960-Pyramimonas_sp.AAC.1